MTTSTPEHPRLDMGCGRRKTPDFWNVDINPKCNPDEVLDLEQTPWPYADDFFEKIKADNVLEHLGEQPRDFAAIVKEMYRVSKDQAEWFICVPHHRCDNAFDDFTHRRVLTPRTFSLFDQKQNHETIQNNQAHSTFGLDYNIDIEVYDVTFNIVGYWQQLQQEGMLGQKQLNINLNTMSNVAESVNIFCRVHKPGRFAHLYKV